MQIKNEFLLRWLEFNSGSESADSHYAWSAISCISACLGTRSNINYGRLSFVPNMYIVLCGPAALRKSTAAKVGVDILRDYTDVKFGPNDTNGMRQGLIAAFQDAYGDREIIALSDNPMGERAVRQADKAVLDVLTAAPPNPLDALIRKSHELQEQRDKDKRKHGKDEPRDLFVFADELASFIGMNQSELINCLTALYYPQKEYSYKLSKSESSLINPALGLLACTTPASLVKHLPEHALGQGFSSRVLFIYAEASHKKVFMPPPYDESERNFFGLAFRRLNQITTTFKHSPAANKIHEAIYRDFIPDIPDTRFSDYVNRRNEHMTKVMMCLAAAEDRTVVTSNDVYDAHMMLVDAESLMTNALGELGLNKTSICKQNMREMIENSFPAGVPMNVLRASAMRDMRTKQEFVETINDFVAKGVCIVETVTPQTGSGSYEVVLPIRTNMKKKKASRSDLERKYRVLDENPTLNKQTQGTFDHV